LADYAAARDAIVRRPVYGVLNLCRVYRYLLDGKINSKKEGGAWAEGALPSELQLVIRQALAIYRGESVDERFAPEGLDAFVHYVEERVSGMLNYVPAVPGCYTQGRTFDQARRRIREALSLWVDDVSTATYIR